MQNATVLILGLGSSGLAMARWCVRQGARHVTVLDTREQPPKLAQLQTELPQVEWRHGPLDAGQLDHKAYNAVFLSPGLAPYQTQALVDAARQRGLVVGNEVSLFGMALQTLRESEEYNPITLAITGTNGKTTVTSLCSQLVARCGKSVVVAGNIGPTLLDTLSTQLDAQTLPQVWVLELSSFQLNDLQGFTPTASALLNITQDHLEWHGSMEAYAAAKARIFGPNTHRVLNRDDERVVSLQPALPAPVKGRKPLPVSITHCTFGADLPQRHGDWGIEIVNGMAWLVQAQSDDGTLLQQRLMPADALRIRGRHNAVNALAALALASAAGCELAPMLYGLREYQGEPHRVESVGIVNEVEYFDDSKGTNVGATVAALAGLGLERRLVVILGGQGKGQDFSPLSEPIQQFARAIILIGQDRAAIAQALQSTGVPMFEAQDMAEAVRVATQQALPGDAVLLSPACASLDMFQDYTHRAQVFCEAVTALASEQGQETIGGWA